MRDKGEREVGGERERANWSNASTELAAFRCTAGRDVFGQLNSGSHVSIDNFIVVVAAQPKNVQNTKPSSD